MSSDFNLDGEQQDSSKGIVGRIGSAIAAAVAWLPRKVKIIATIVALALLVIILLTAFKPEAKKRPVPDIVVKVDVIEVAQSGYPINVNTSGTIQADTRGNLVSQIRGEIVEVSDKFKTGGSFAKGDVLIQIDQRDYLADLSQAAAAVSQAQVAYRQEQANAKQAVNDWQRLGNVGNAPDLVARKPQLAAAKAQLDSANARYQTAELNLERTNIKAPYTGRVIRREAVLGQYVGVGTMLAEVFATDGVEARLPISQAEYSQLGLDALNNGQNRYSVVLSTELGNRRYTWDANITRTDSTFDISTRQIDVIATVVDPFNSTNKANQPPLKIGQFVNATIQGPVLDNVMVVPNKAIREGNYVFVSQEQVLVRKPIAIAWQDNENAVIENGLEVGDLVVTTSLNSTLAGAKVKLPESFENNTASEETEVATPGEGLTEEAATEQIDSQQGSLEQAVEQVEPMDEKAIINEIEPSVDNAANGEPSTEESTADDSITGEPAAAEQMIEEPVIEEPKVDAPAIGDSAIDSAVEATGEESPSAE